MGVGGLPNFGFVCFYSSKVACLAFISHCELFNCHKLFGERRWDSFIALWETRSARVIHSSPLVGMMNFQDPYMQWYRHITRRFMTPRLHRDDMRFHTTAGSMNVMVSRIDVFI